MTIADTKFRLTQFHFHHPSEEKIDGQRFDLSIHLVHSTEDGKLAVIGLLANVGQPNSLVGEITSDLPETVGEELKLGGRHKLTDLFPSGSGAAKSFRFQGSLTTPPCSEAVDWTVFRKPITVSEAQLKRLTASYPMNSRPTQPAEGREIKIGETAPSAFAPSGT